MKVQPNPFDKRDGIIYIDDAGRQVLSFERLLEYPVERVWTAITDPQEVRKWARARWDFEPWTGGKMTLVLGITNDSDGDRDEGVVTAYTPPTVLEFTIPYYAADGPDSGEHKLRWELRSTNDGTLLKFSDVFAPGQRVRNAIATGWHYMLDRLEEGLAGTSPSWDNRDSEMERIYWRYRRAPRPLGWPA
jgi:uncharacterized protein YndB with AHSA1/START domain